MIPNRDRYLGLPSLRMLKGIAAVVVLLLLMAAGTVVVRIVDCSGRAGAPLLQAVPVAIPDRVASAMPTRISSVGGRWLLSGSKTLWESSDLAEWHALVSYRDGELTGIARHRSVWRVAGSPSDQQFGPEPVVWSWTPASSSLVPETIDRTSYTTSGFDWIVHDRSGWSAFGPTNYQDSPPDGALPTPGRWRFDEERLTWQFADYPIGRRLVPTPPEYSPSIPIGLADVAAAGGATMLLEDVDNGNPNLFGRQKVWLEPAPGVGFHQSSEFVLRRSGDRVAALQPLGWRRWIAVGNLEGEREGSTRSVVWDSTAGNSWSAPAVLDIPSDMYVWDAAGRGGQFVLLAESSDGEGSGRNFGLWRVDFRSCLGVV